MSTLRTRALPAVAAVLTLGSLLAVAAPAEAVPRGIAQYFFGPKLVRMEAVVRDAGADRLFRLDRGRVRAVRPLLGTVTLLERDGTQAVVDVAPDAEITVRGRSVALGALRRNMVVTTVREGDAPAHAVYVGAVPRTLTLYLLGPKLVRLEAVVRDAGQVRLYRVDKGRARAVRPAAGTLSVLQRDGTLAVIPIAADADIFVRGRAQALSAVRRNMLVTTVREGDAPAELVLAQR